MKISKLVIAIVALLGSSTIAVAYQCTFSIQNQLEPRAKNIPSISSVVNTSLQTSSSFNMNQIDENSLKEAVKSKLVVGMQGNVSVPSSWKLNPNIDTSFGESCDSTYYIKVYTNNLSYGKCTSGFCTGTTNLYLWLPNDKGGADACKSEHDAFAQYLGLHSGGQIGTRTVTWTCR